MTGTPSMHGARVAVDHAELRERVRDVLAAFLATQHTRLEAVSTELRPVMTASTEFLLDGGKRLRPAFCYWGWRGAGNDDDAGIVAAAACLEFLHACALVHDDVMDGSDTRRGRPAVHRSFAALHRGEQWRGDAEAFGVSAAILLGDLCLIWADEVYNTAGLPAAALERGRRVYDEMRVELMAGQYLDLLEQAMAGTSITRALRVARYKSAKYTIEKPLHLGAVLAGAGQHLLDCYSAYGLPLGEAFQLRDDVLGVFGDPTETGKPAGDDLREGKRTALVAIAMEAATPIQATTVRRHLGDPHLSDDGVALLRGILEETGALSRVEQLITELTGQALGALDPGVLDPLAAEVLRGLAVAATARRV